MSVAKQYRIGVRVPHEIYQTLCKAAELSGATINQFLVQAALKEAHEVIERDATIRMSPRDWSQILALLDNPPQANPELQAAMQRYRDVKQMMQILP